MENNENQNNVNDVEQTETVEQPEQAETAEMVEQTEQTQTAERTEQQEIAKKVDFQNIKTGKEGSSKKTWLTLGSILLVILAIGLRYWRVQYRYSKRETQSSYLLDSSVQKHVQSQQESVSKANRTNFSKLSGKEPITSNRILSKRGGYSIIDNDNKVIKALTDVEEAYVVDFIDKDNGQTGKVVVVKIGKEWLILDSDGVVLYNIGSQNISDKTLSVTLSKGVFSLDNSR